jgi:hypothetical protein
MFDDILRIFDFLSPKQTQEPIQRKPMAIPVDEPLKSRSTLPTNFPKIGCFGSRRAQSG